MLKTTARFGGATILSAAFATPALAHHPLGGMPMETFVHGVLSGIGHPILGFDHLFFVIVVGVAAMLAGRALVAPAAYIGAMLVGCLLMSLGLGLPAKELFVALSLLVLGGLVLSGRTVAPTLVMALFAAFGLFHGSAFGDTLAAQEAGIGGAALIGYLLGLGAVQYLIAIGCGWLARNVLGATHAGAVNARLAGGVVAGIGLFLTLEVAEGVALGALGWAG